MPKSLPFDWMEPRRNSGHGKTEKARREAMYRTEIEERAALLHRLGHGREAVRTRLAANLGWDFAPSDSPIAAATLDAILDRVFGSNPGQPKSAPKGRGGAR